MKNKTLSYANGTPIVKGDRQKATIVLMSSKSIYRHHHHHFGLSWLMSTSLDVCHTMLEEFDHDGYHFKITSEKFFTLGSPIEQEEIKIYYQPTK